jgi:hypothetical protein
MKKAMACLAAFMATSVALFAGMEDRDFDFSVVGTGTGTVTYVLRGELQAVRVDFAAARTGTVTVASEELTLFSKATIAADATFLPRAVSHDSGGVVLTNAVYGGYVAPPMAGPITVTVVGEDGMARTNAAKITLIYKQ